LEYKPFVLILRKIYSRE